MLSLLLPDGMEPTRWTARLETGHAEMDAQHRELFRAHAAALEVVRAGAASAVQAALLSLLELTRRHFQFEERLMEAAAYRHRDNHVQAHAAFTEDLALLATTAARDDGSPVVRLWLESRYDSWWKFHVCRSDLALAAAVASQVGGAVPGGAGGAPAA